MKLIITIIHERDRSKVSEALLHGGHKFTKVASTGGFLRDGNCTLLIGAEDDQVEEIMAIVRENCHAREQYMSLPPPDVMPTGAFIPSPIKVTVGGAVTFVLPVERSEKA